VTNVSDKKFGSVRYSGPVRATLCPFDTPALGLLWFGSVWLTTLKHIGKHWIRLAVALQVAEVTEPFCKQTA